MQVKIVKIYEDSRLPVKATEGATAYDIFCHRLEKLEDGTVICYTGIKMTPPKGYAIKIEPRSSLTKYPFVIGNSPGRGDEDFTGEYQIRFKPITLLKLGSLYSLAKDIMNNFPYKKGDRIAQISLEKVNPITFILVDDLVETKRGEGGFGSTGLS